MLGLQAGDLRLKADLAAQRFDAPPQILHHGDEQISPNVGLGIIGDVDRRAGLV